MLELFNVSKTYDGGKSFVVKDVSLTIQDGETVVLLGTSGSGKSTLLGMLNRLIEPSSGTIYMDQKAIALLDPVALRRSIGCVFQDSCLLPHWTIEDNVATVLRLIGMERPERLQRAHALLDQVKLAPQIFAKRFPCQLSGGQQQRVNVARALANHPNYLLMDEPFSALDVITRLSLQQDILQLKKHLKKTIIFVTHDIAEAFMLADKLVIMQAGTIDQVGSPAEVFAAPATPFVANLLSHLSPLQGPAA